MQVILWQLKYIPPFLAAACVNIGMRGLQQHIKPFTAEIQLKFVHLVRQNKRGTRVKKKLYFIQITVLKIIALSPLDDMVFNKNR